MAITRGCGSSHTLPKYCSSSWTPPSLWIIGRWVSQRLGSSWECLCGQIIPLRAYYTDDLTKGLFWHPPSWNNADYARLNSLHSYWKTLPRYTNYTAISTACTNVKIVKAFCIQERSCGMTGVNMTSMYKLLGAVWSPTGWLYSLVISQRPYLRKARCNSRG